MAWEARGQRRYYYTSHKCRGRVVKRYCGGGEAGEMAAALEAEARASRAERENSPSPEESDVSGRRTRRWRRWTGPASW